jgi:nicotinamide-nucleotide amidase
MQKAEGGNDTAMMRAEDAPDLEAKANALLERCCDRDITIATAESCTGGLIAALLTDIEGVSHAFDRAFVVYTEAAKTEMLGVSAELIDSQTAVSREVAVAMAKGAIERSQADVAVAVTGYAGATSEGTEGLMHLAVVQRHGTTDHRCVELGKLGRDRIRSAAAAIAFDMTMETLSR